MSGLAAGLARGLAMYGQGRMIAEDREYERQQKEAERKRQEARDAVLMEQTRLSMENTRQEMERRKQQDGIAAEGRTNEAIGKGFRPVGDQWDTFNDMVGIDPSKAETITVNGQQMRKVAPTQAFQDGMRQRREQDTALQQQAAEQNRMLETIRAQLPKAVRPLAVDLKTAQTLLGKYAEQRMAPPRQEAPVSWERVNTAQGIMQVNPRTGEVRPLRVNGQPLTEAAGMGGKLTDGQRRAAGLVSMADAERTKMDELGTPNWWDRLMARVPLGAGEMLMSDKGQQYMSAAEGFARPYLYTVSGANATDSEVASTARQVIPGVFTRSNTDADMRQRRGRMVEGMKTIAGQNGAPVSRDESEAAAAFRRQAKAEGYSDEEIDAELQRRGMR